jgi:hypothetical protein
LDRGASEFYYSCIILLGYRYLCSLSCLDTTYYNLPEWRLSVSAMTYKVRFYKQIKTAPGDADVYLHADWELPFVPQVGIVFTAANGNWEAEAEFVSYDIPSGLYSIATRPDNTIRVGGKAPDVNEIVEDYIERGWFRDEPED